MFTLRVCVVSWGIKKQTLTIIRTAEEEYIAYNTTVYEALWLKHFMRGIEVIKETESMSQWT